MAVGIGAAGIVGIAFETTPGTYAAPTKYLPILSETLAWKQTTVWRRTISGKSDRIGVVADDGSFDGDIVMEALHDCVPYILYAGRMSIAKTGPVSTIYTYVATSTHVATPPTGRTLSITIVRNGVTFGYTNCIVTKMVYTIVNGLLQVTFTIMGSDESDQTTPTPTWPTSVQFGAVQYYFEIPTATQVFDCDAFTLSIDNAGVQNYRYRNTGRGPAFASFGDRTVELDVTRDFQSKTDYTAFKALTAQGITVKAVNGTKEIDFLVPAAIADTYQVDLPGTAELIKAQVKYRGTYDTGTSEAYAITVKTDENIT